ncbi:helix-turn-helix transcriptional regulator [Nodosilinea sp. LEGE 06152]|uniref:helix-turn-helix domain-containing protein n=1 Tax=Nodosilinea sp. LEGE 06152 TaxID=2777966 RepID=UPI001881F361|nr:helix-turn-helix transcriptional regulator [Nodosilinea sp. LEGE 06152]MBE9156004.1 helix-turn-helix transcriptional regulator [Nodosilinea sp. LEGE 06152]
MKVICYLAKLMEERGLSQASLAEATGLSPNTVGKLYRNQFSRIDMETIVTLCKYLGCQSISELIEIEAADR